MKKSIILYSLFFVLAVSPFFASAAKMPDIFPTGYWATDGLVSCAKTCTPEEIQAGCQAGCQSFDELIQVFLNVISFGMTLALFVASPILFAWGGIMIMIAGGDPGKAAQGKKILTGTVIGVVIILSSFLIIRTFVGLLNICGIGGFTPPCPT